MKYRPQHEANPLPFSPFKSSTVPRPIGWLSSVSTDGRENIAPYSQWQNLTFDPPMVMFSANQYPDGRRKDTVLNAEQTGWFVWNMATYDLREAVNVSAMALEPGESEWDRIAEHGVTKVYADNHPIPMVAESPVRFECRYHSTHRIKGDSNVGTIDVVFASDQTAPLTPNSSATASRAMVCTSRNEAKVPSSMPNSGNGSTTKSRPKAMTSGRRPTRSPSRPAPRMAARKITWATSEAERVVDLSI